MIRDDVCIVLNEREPLKQRMAEKLDKHLSLRGVACVRISPLENIASVLKKRLPRFLVLDFILGDVATALDVLTDLEQEIRSTAIIPIMWTDEASIQVIVTAMKLGAVDYIPLNESASLEKVVHTIENLLPHFHKEKPLNPTRKFNLNFETPIGGSTQYNECLRAVRSLATRNYPVSVLLGSSGCGKSTIARYLHQHRTKAGSLVEIDLDIWAEDLENLVGSQSGSYSVPLLSHASTVVLDHAEHDCGELIESVLKQSSTLWPKLDNKQRSMLVIGTNCKETARAWNRLLQAEIITIPNLSERIDDIFELYLHFASQAYSSPKTSRLPKLSSPFVHLLANLSWPGDLREFKATVEEIAVSLNEKQFSNSTDSEDTNKIEEHDVSKLTSSEIKLLRLILYAKARWERYHHISPYVPSSLLARRTVDNMNGNLRIAAARLGTGIPQIRSALGLDHKNTNESSEPLP